MSDAPKDNLEELASLVLTEMLTRVKDNPGDVSTPVLSRLATDLNRFIERRVRDEEEEEHKPFNLFDELKALPEHRALALALEELKRFEGEADRLRQWIADHSPATGSGLPHMQVGQAADEPGNKAGIRAAEVRQEV